MSQKGQQKNTSTVPKDTAAKGKSSKLQWFIFVILIPFLFSIAVVLVILTISGLNVFDLMDKYGEDIPTVSKLLDDENVQEDPDTAVIELTATIEDQKVEIANLRTELDTKLNEIEDYQQQIESITTELKLLQETENVASMKVKEIARLYETMSSKKSAAILTEMDNEEVLDILVNMNNETRAAILEKLDPEKAAELTVMLKAQQDDNKSEQIDSPETAVRADIASN